MGRKTPFIIAGLAAAILFGVFLWAAIVWNGVPDEISPAGWGAVVLGVLVALALGMGLMALMFASQRGGYDESPKD
jgi:hypothetical protein